MRVLAPGQMALTVMPYLPEVARDHAGEAGDAVLGGAVVRLAGVAEDAGRGRHRDDAAAPLLAHARRGVPGAVEGALQVHGDDRVPLLLASC